MSKNTMHVDLSRQMEKTTNTNTHTHHKYPAFQSSSLNPFLLGLIFEKNH